MKHVLFLGATLLFASSLVQAQPRPTLPARSLYSNVWRPITTQGIREGIHLNRSNGVGLEQIMARALLQQKALDYLIAVQAESKLQPKNATLVAAYGWALASVRNSYTFGGAGDKTRSVPSYLSTRFNFDWQNIRDTIQRAKDMDAHCWLAYIAEATLNPGGPPPTQEAAATKKAFEIERNAVTLTRYGSALMFQSAGAHDKEGIRQGQQLLLRAERLYPTYYRSSYEVYRSYGYPAVKDEQQRLVALRRFYNNIPPQYRQSTWVVRYLKFIGLERRLLQIGITLPTTA